MAHISPTGKGGECDILFCCKINQENIDFQMFDIYLNGKTLQTLLLPILVTKKIFLKQFFILLYLWEKYEPI